MRTLPLALAVLLAATGRAQQPASAPDVQTLGPQVGATVPGFSLPDHAGRPRTLQSVMGPKGALLVFFRSADW
jgi:hypothetical protein